jgi:hypothetical protein
LQTSPKPVSRSYATPSTPAPSSNFRWAAAAQTVASSGTGACSPPHATGHASPSLPKERVKVHATVRGGRREESIGTTKSLRAHAAAVAALAASASSAPGSRGPTPRRARPDTLAQAAGGA